MKKISIFLDSGAFSSFTHNEEVDIDAYISFIEKYKSYIDMYANLDVIGDVEATWKNQQYMESKGLHPMPCFHLHEDMEYLHMYCKKYPYIAMGGLVGSTKETTVPWLDRCWDIICDTEDRTPMCKVHGFGVTSLYLLFRYPWYSVDSSSWLAAGRFGSVLVPKNFDYTKDPWKVSVSTRSPDQKDDNSWHFLSMSPLEQSVVLKYFDSIGFSLGKSEFRYVDPHYVLQKNEHWCKDPQVKIYDSYKEGDLIVETIVEDGLCNNHISRDHANFLYYRNLEKHLPSWPQAFTKKIRTFGLG